MKPANLAMTLLIAMLGHQAQAQTFEIIDGSATVAGEPSYAISTARANWNVACDKWKSETKELNKIDQIMMLSCQSPSCSANENGESTCTSTALVKVKTIGTRAQAVAPVFQPQAPPQIPEETIVETAPPPVFVETVPAPRPGFIWTTGYWGWAGNHHHWYPGHWQHHRPGYVWIAPRWESHRHGWRFFGGHWR